ncbi:insulin-degrading enzyme-like 1, peroxisomal isoform X1 [Eucalyptus grandis]|uniref:insulin-degrading enzyme-like 1, peroxisomal isoform X1 n=1 Tax=Eucalyptus grandis TaxID=71139 RepID=UPI00192E9741|nr:insulin-degrading enzyme-like 1, peroxisomal isoform X1 [Eucalyptus grandis]
MYIYFVCVFTYIYKLGIDSMQKYFLFHILIPPVSGVLHLQHAHSFSDFLKLEVSGYYHKLWVLLDTILKAMADFTVKPERFSVIKEKLTKSYQNFKFDEPRYHASYYLSLILNDHSWPWEEDLEILETLQPEDLSRFAPRMLSRAFLECYIAGNMEHDEAESIVHHVEDVLMVLILYASLCSNPAHDKQTRHTRRGFKFRLLN